MIVRRTSIFPAIREEVFEKLQRLETLQYIAAPYASFSPLQNDDPLHWEAGRKSSYRFKLFGHIPFGIHTIRIIRFDRDEVLSHEHNTHVPVWNHRIILKDLRNGRTEYTDEVEIHAGFKTLPVWLWAQMFYTHRQRKWIHLLNQNRK